MFESKWGIFYIAGIGFFVLAFVSNAVVPWLMYSHLQEQTVAELINPNLRYQFEDLARRYPESFEAAFGKPPGGEAEHDEWWNKTCGDALRIGHKLYVGEGCWHCHSQFIRPVSNEEERWGPVSRSAEYQNELQRPVLFGTRRVGPDLCREGGRRSNDWHAVHFYRPESLSYESPMPEYPWFFDGSADKPNKKGLAIMTYVQWLGSWQESYPYYEAYVPTALSKPAEEEGDAAANAADDDAADAAGDDAEMDAEDSSTPADDAASVDPEPAADAEAATDADAAPADTAPEAEPAPAEPAAEEATTAEPVPVAEPTKEESL